MKKIMSALLAMVLCVSLLASCNTNKETKSEAPAGPQEVTLKTVGMFGGTDPSAAAYSEMIENFEKDNDGVKIEDQSATADEAWKTSVRTSFETGDEPDVLFFFTTADADSILESCVTLDEIKAEYPDYCNWISETAYKSATCTDGTQYAVPIRGFWESLFVNENLFTDAGADLPTDWDKFTASFAKLNAKGVTPIAVGAADEPHYAWECLILAHSTAENFSSNPGTDISKVPASWIDGLNAFKSLNDMKAFAKDVASTGEAAAKELFFTKKAGMIWEGSWAAGGITSPDDTTVVLTPTAPTANKTTSDIVGGFSSGFYITRKAWEDDAKRDAAVKFVEAATSKAAITAYCQAGGIPACEGIAIDGQNKAAKAGEALLLSADNAIMPIGDRMGAGFKAAYPDVPDIITGKTDGKASFEKFVEANK